MQITDGDRVTYGWLLLNIPFFFLLIAGFITGSLQPIFHDVTYITHVIFFLFLGTLLHTGWIALTVAKQFENIDELKREYEQADPKNAKQLLELEFEKLLMFPNFMMNFLVGLGFLGTIIGVIIGFQYFPAEAFTDLSKMQEFVRMMLTGFATELHTLLMGFFAKTWLSIIGYNLEKSLLRLFTRIIE